MGRTGSRQIVISLDAFGTLFTPRETIAKSYADAARKFGLSGFTEEQLASRFRDAFKHQSAIAPNYGKKIDMGASNWWSNVRKFALRITQLFDGYHGVPQSAP